MAQALAVSPDVPMLHTAALVVAIRVGDHAATLRHMSRADLSEMDRPTMLLFKAAALAGTDDLDGAEAAAQAAHELRPGDQKFALTAAHFQRRRITEGRGDVSELVTVDIVPRFDRERAAATDDLRAGRLKEGFAKGQAMSDAQAVAALHAVSLEPEPGFAMLCAGRSPVPRWDGSANDQLRLAVLTPPGLGDTIQFLRYLPAARRLVGHVSLVVAPPLVPIVEADEVFSVNQVDEALRGADAFIQLVHLCAFVADDHAIADMGRFRRDPAKVRDLGPGYHVGLCWAGGPLNAVDSTRSAPVAALAPLAAVAGVAFHSLQIGTRAVEAATAPVRMIDHAAEIGDFADTLALIDALDLVIAVETSTAHLAASVGARIWVALSHEPDWRWGDEGETTPWYPGARLFRQATARRDWDAVFTQIADQLKRFAVVEGGRSNEPEDSYDNH